MPSLSKTVSAPSSSLLLPEVNRSRMKLVRDIASSLIVRISLTAIALSLGSFSWFRSIRRGLNFSLGVRQIPICRSANTGSTVAAKILSGSRVVKRCNRKNRAFIVLNLLKNENSTVETTHGPRHQFCLRQRRFATNGIAANSSATPVGSGILDALKISTLSLPLLTTT